MAVYLASCDKGMPGNLMGLARVDTPAVVVPGGTMNAGPDMLTLEQLGMYSAKYQRGEIDEEKLNWAKCNACPSCGACSFIGTASTMQIFNSDARHQPGPFGLCQAGGAAGGEAGCHGTYAAVGHCDCGKF